MDWVTVSALATAGGTLILAPGDVRVGVDLLYGDHEGSQRMISRFALSAVPNGSWLATVGATGTWIEPIPADR